jgi:hypothetical protein
VNACRSSSNPFKRRHYQGETTNLAAKGYGSLPTAGRILRDIEAIEIVRKGGAKWLSNGNVHYSGKVHQPLVGYRL